MERAEVDTALIRYQTMKDRLKDAVATRYPEYGFALTTSGEIGQLCGYAESCWDTKQYVRIETIPDKERQTDYTRGEGPGVMSQGNLAREATPLEMFAYTKGYITVERMIDRFTELKSFVPIHRGIILMGTHLSSRRRREAIEKICGSYPSHNIHFCASDQKGLEDIHKARVALWNNTLLQGWELANDSDGNWEHSFPEQILTVKSGHDYQETRVNL